MVDFRYAVLSLMRSRWFTAGAVITYALGIGANLVVFAAVDQMLLRPLPYARPSDLVCIVSSSGDRLYSRTPRPIVTDALAATEVFQGVAVAGQASRVVVGPANEDATIRLAEATYQLLGVLGVRPALGRSFTREDASSKARVAMIRYETWQQRFAGQSDIIGRQVGTGSGVYEIVGVLPAGFHPPTTFLGATDGLRLDPDMLDPGRLQDGVWPAIARLRPGVTIASAQAVLNTVASRTSTALGAPADRPIQVRVLPIRDAMFYGYRTYLWLAAAAATTVPTHRLREPREPLARARSLAGARHRALGGARRVARAAGSDGVLRMSGGRGCGRCGGGADSQRARPLGHGARA